VEREIIDAEVDRRADGAGHCRWDIEELEIEETARARLSDELDGARAMSGEELEPDLEDADVILQQFDQALSFIELGHIEWKDETIARLSKRGAHLQRKRLPRGSKGSDAIELELIEVLEERIVVVVRIVELVMLLAAAAAFSAARRSASIRAASSALAFAASSAA